MKKQVKEFYDAIGAFYDKFYYDSKASPYYHYGQKIIAEIIDNEITSDKFILDAGCGTMHWTIYLAKKGHKVVGLDISRGITAGRNKIKTEKIIGKSIDIVIADVANLPFRDSTFSSVISLFGVLNHLPDHKKALAEITRVTKVGGKVIVGVSNYLRGGSRSFWDSVSLFKSSRMRDEHKERKWDFEFESKQLRLYQHLFTYDELKLCLQSQGLTIKKIVGVPIIPMPRVLREKYKTVCR
ncbi:MAG: class I SAM-dependent methyltransferase, partial [Thermoproteota archaeon]